MQMQGSRNMCSDIHGNPYNISMDDKNVNLLKKWGITNDRMEVFSVQQGCMHKISH